MIGRGWNDLGRERDAARVRARERRRRVRAGPGLSRTRLRGAGGLCLPSGSCPCPLVPPRPVGRPSPLGPWRRPPAPRSCCRCAGSGSTASSRTRSASGWPGCGRRRSRACGCCTGAGAGERGLGVPSPGTRARPGGRWALSQRARAAAPLAGSPHSLVSRERPGSVAGPGGARKQSRLCLLRSNFGAEPELMPKTPSQRRRPRKRQSACPRDGPREPGRRRWVRRFSLALPRVAKRETREERFPCAQQHEIAALFPELAHTLKRACQDQSF